jgi:hypothetical protein
MIDPKSTETGEATRAPLEELDERVLKSGLNSTLASRARVTLTHPQDETSYAVIDRSQPKRGAVVELPEPITVGNHTSSQYRVFVDGSIWQALQSGDEYSLLAGEREDFNTELSRVLSPLTRISIEIEL